MKEVESTEMPITVAIIFKKSSNLKCKRMIHIRKRQLPWLLACPTVMTRPAAAILQPVRSQLENKANTVR